VCFQFLAAINYMEWLQSEQILRNPKLPEKQSSISSLILHGQNSSAPSFSTFLWVDEEGNILSN